MKHIRLSFAIVLLVGAFASYSMLRRLYLVRTAPIATARSRSIPWNRSQLVHWSYTLQANTRVGYFVFNDDSTAIATVGGPLSEDLPHLGLKAGDKNVMEVTTCGFYWRISSDGRLLLTEALNGEPTTTLVLVYLDENIASVWNESLNAPEVYWRSPPR